MVSIDHQQAYKRALRDFDNVVYYSI